MRSSFTKKSGARISPHSKRDRRGRHLIWGTPLRKQLWMIWQDGHQKYHRGMITKILVTAQGVRSQSAKWITTRSIVRVLDDADVAHQVMITHRDRKSQTIIGKSIS